MVVQTLQELLTGVYLQSRRRVKFGLLLGSRKVVVVEE